MAFNPKEHITLVSGKDYLEVKWRLVWFREDHPNWGIDSDPVILSDSMAIVKTIITDETGRIIASGMATVRSADSARTSWSGRDFEKAETASIGRALAHAGYGTQFTDEDEGDYLADSPVERKQAPPKQAKKSETKEAEAVTEQVTEATVTVVTKIDRNSKPYLNIEGVGIFSREPLRELDYDVEGLDKEGVHVLPDPVRIVYSVNDKNFRKALRIQRVKTEKVAQIA